MSNKKISIAGKMLMTIKQSLSLSKLLKKNQISFSKQTEMDEFEEVLNDAEDTINDYMAIGYTEDEARAAYGTLVDY